MRSILFGATIALFAFAFVGQASADILSLTVTGTVAPYTWNGSRYTSAPLIDTAGVFGTPGENLFGDPFTVRWIIDSSIHVNPNDP
jgi:hypothetical protein